MYIACRNETKANEAIARLEQECAGKKALFLRLDLADLNGIKKAAETYATLETTLDVLFNNACVALWNQE